MSSRLRVWHAVVVAFFVRLSYVLLVTASQPPRGDSFYYVTQGEWLAAGHGFSEPLYFFGGMPAADHPPLNALFMTPGPWLASNGSKLFGLPSSIFLQRLTLVVVGTVTVAVLANVAKRLVLRSRWESQANTAAVVTALVAALNPSLWINDGILMAESVTALCIAMVLWCAVVAWDKRDWRWWALLGAAIGLASLARAESIALLVVLALPMLWTTARHSRRASAVASAACIAGCVAVASLWLVPNSIRFQVQTFYSTNDGLTLLGANCPYTYSGDQIGLWSLRCLDTVDTNRNGVDDFADLEARDVFKPRDEDQSQVSLRYRDAGLAYLRSHPAALAKVVPVRIARTWGLWNPAQMVAINEGENRVPWVSWLAWAVHLAMLPCAVRGALTLRRLGRPSWPFLSQALAVTLVSAGIYGLARFRIGWDVAACVLVGVWITTKVGMPAAAPPPSNVESLSAAAAATIT